MTYRVYETREGSHYRERSPLAGNGGVSFSLGRRLVRRAVYLLLAPFAFLLMLLVLAAYPVLSWSERWKTR